jgi:dolichyl-diphosphooligosaccharide---protein glycosyltransferase subunit 1 (ribophorin I)
LNISPNSYYVVTFPEALKPSDSVTLSFSYAILSSVHPLPAQIDQTAQQTVTYPFSAYFPSAYITQKQKTKLKLPTSNPADFTKLPNKNTDGEADPVHQGSAVTYGPYDKIKPGSVLPVSVRYEYTKPLLRANKFERDIEVSHWGGNIAFEERYWFTNRAAKLKNQFSRVAWQLAQYGNPPTSAAKEIRMVMHGGAANPYYIDDIGNVSTSKFRPSRKEALLDIKPRYPVFGGWNYSFKIGWDANLKNFLRRGPGEKFVLKVPFMEGPRSEAGVEYGSVTVRVVLPEGAK